MFGPGEGSVVIECSANGTCTTIHAIVSSGILFFLLLTGFAYTTLLERRLLAWIQSRIGPNRAGPKGLLQPVADGIKLIFKEDVTPAGANKVIFWLSPVIKVVPALLVVAVVPLGPKVAIPWFDGNWYRINQGLVDVNVGALWILGITSIGIYGIVLSGWSSNNKYSMMGGLRSSAQMISYELSMGLAVVVPVMLAGSMSIGDIIDAQNDPPILGWFVFQNPIAAAVLFVALLAEVNRAPFDLPEAEQELTAGYHTEYSGMKFALFFMAEYIGMITVSIIGAAFYLGGYHFIFVDELPLLGPLAYMLKVILLLSGMIWVRATFPRIRYDKLMQLGWKIMLPVALTMVVWTSVLIMVEVSVSRAVYLVFAWVTGIIMLLLAIALFGRFGRVQDSVDGRVEVVSMSGSSGVGTMAFRAVDKVVSGTLGSDETRADADDKRSDA